MEEKERKLPWARGRDREEKTTKYPKFGIISAKAKQNKNMSIRGGRVKSILSCIAM